MEIPFEIREFDPEIQRFQKEYSYTSKVDQEEFKENSRRIARYLREKYPNRFKLYTVAGLASQDEIIEYITIRIENGKFYPFDVVIFYDPNKGIVSNETKAGLIYINNERIIFSPLFFAKDGIYINPIFLTLCWNLGLTLEAAAWLYNFKGLLRVDPRVKPSISPYFR